MTTRIRYKETKDSGIYESVKVFQSQSTGANYKVFIDLNEKSYRIRNELSKTNTTIRVGGITNLNFLKKAAKKSLEKLGVRFVDESRDRTFGLCDKGYNQKLHTQIVKETPSQLRDE